MKHGLTNQTHSIHVLEAETLRSQLRTTIHPLQIGFILKILT